MGASRHMTEDAALDAVRVAIASIPPGERSLHAIEARLKRSGHPIGRSRIRRLLEEHDGLLDIAPTPVARLVHISDHPVKKALREVKDIDTLEQMEALANEIITMVAEALPGLKIENSQ